MQSSLKPAAIFSNNMVLQRNKNIKLWGTGIDNQKVIVTLASKAVSTVVQNNAWSLEFPPMPAGGPYNMIITSKDESICYENIMIGEVWLAGGQSNMEFELCNSKNGKEVVENASDLNIRFYSVPRLSYIDDKFDEEESKNLWELCSPETCGKWSAVGYYFAKEIASKLGITIGIISCNYGGTSASAWISSETLSKDIDTKSYVDEYEKACAVQTFEDYCKELDEYNVWYEVWQKKVDSIYKENPDVLWSKVLSLAGECRWPGPLGPKSWFRAGGLYETMLKRVCPYTLKGFLYYQGESDDHKPLIYGKLLRTLITEWRRDWNDYELPFLIVQLPMFIGKEDKDRKNWPLIREHQMQTHQTIKNTGIAVTLDLGEFDNIHPLDKEPVGKRLALQAFYHLYGEEISPYGPIYKNRILHPDKIELLFNHAENGFNVNGNEIIGFEIAGEDMNFICAKAEIYGDKIFVSNSTISNPKYVRYNWTNYGPVTLFGKNGIPLAPFRTQY